MPANWNEYVRRRMPALGVRPERESEIVAELAEQMRQAYQEWIALGHSEEEAMSHAEVQVRDWSALGTELRDAERPAPRYRFLPGLRHDIRYSLRGLRRNPVFACVAIATLAFAIAGNTAIFAVVDHIALHGLPYPDAARLLAIEHTRVDEPGLESWCAIDNLLDLRKNNQTFQAIAGVSPVWNVVMTGEGEVERLESLFASSDFFPMLGVTPLIGRLFSAADDNRAGAAPVVVLSHSFWARRFGASPAVLGRTLVLDGQPFAIVGVLPRDFRWLGEPLAGTAINIDLWMPLAANQLARSPRTLRFLKVTGQLKPGVSTQQGIDEVRRIGESLTPAFPAANKNLTFTAVPLEQKIAGRVRPAVYLLLATVGFVLLMASANVANLLLARAAGRKQELSIRVALGASPGRLIRQWMTESGVIAILGGGLGVLLAHVFLRLILEYGPPATVKTVPISLDWRAMLFSGGVVMLTAVLSGIVPAWRTMSGPALREGRGTTKGNRRVRSLLVVTQVTLAVVLLSGAGLLVRSFLQVLKVDPGFNLHNVVSISTQLPAGTNTAEQRTNVYHKIRDELLAVPGVTAVAAVSRLPLLGQTLSSLLYIEGKDTAEHPPEVEFRAATPSYFATMGIPLLAGRLFDDADGAGQKKLLIDDVAARRYFAGEDPIGRRIRFLADANGPWFEVIGVVGAIRHFGLEAEARPTIYRPAIINPLAAPVFVIRTVNDPASLTQTLATVVRTAYGNMPAYNIYSMDQLVQRSTAERRFLMWLLTAFAIAALLLAAIGIYGAISQSVLQRTQEMGVRIALGAAPGAILRSVIAEGLSMAGAGVLLGVALGIVLAKVGERLLFGVRPDDLLVFGVTAITLLASAALACYVPARRATRVDPLIALRDA